MGTRSNGWFRRYLGVLPQAKRLRCWGCKLCRLIRGSANSCPYAPTHDGCDDKPPLQDTAGTPVPIMNEATSLGTEEQNLRVLLQADPYHFEHSRALIAVLLRTGRPPFPDIPIVQGNFDPQDLAGLEELLHSSDEHAHAGETDRVYATIWQACIRYPQTARGWAEFARCLAERREWNNSRTAAERVLNARATDPETAKPLLAALGI